MPDHGPNTEASDFAAVRFDEDQFDEARAYFTSMLPQFQSLSGVVLFMMSVLLTRGEGNCLCDALLASKAAQAIIVLSPLSAPSVAKASDGTGRSQGPPNQFPPASPKGVSRGGSASKPK